MGESGIIHSVGTLAQLFRVPVHRIEYVIRSRRIAHVGVAGNVRLYNSAAAQRIGSELQHIADARSKMGYARTGPRRWLRDSSLNSTVQEEVR